jgi:hypothetical protein
VFLHAFTYANTGIEKVNVTSKNKTWMFDYIVDSLKERQTL